MTTYYRFHIYFYVHESKWGENLISVKYFIKLHANIHMTFEKWNTFYSQLLKQQFLFIQIRKFEVHIVNWNKTNTKIQNSPEFLDRCNTWIYNNLHVCAI